MAHVKVVRRSMGKEEWILLRTSWINKRIIKKSVKLNGWSIREARQVDEMKYEFYDKDFRPINDGEIYFTPDGTCFLKIEVKIPEELLKEKVYLQFKTAAEMIVKINGKWADGIDPNRDRVLLGENFRSGDMLLIEIEGYNRSKPDDERNPKSSALKGCRQVFDSGSLITINEEVENISYDLNILTETMESEYVKEEIREFIKNELDKALNIIDYEESDEKVYLENIRKARNYVDEKIFNNNTFGKIGNVALVAHSHLDIAYYWRRIHSVQKNARTCLIQLRLMDKYSDFKYSHSQAFTYEMLEKYYPELFEEVKKRVAEERFEPVGAMYVEPDCNIPSAESLIRQCLFGQQFFRTRFNKTIDNCWLPDVFGNSWIMPQILKKSGIKYFISNKMSTWNDTNKFPHNHFKWKGIDGTEIYACVPPTHFISWNSPEQIIENWESFQDKDSCNETLSMFGYGDGGSGATAEMIEYMHRIEKIPGLPNVRHISAKQFLDENLDNNESLETWDGELYLEMHRGTFTTKSKIKKWNRKLEILICDAEMLSSIASIYGFEYPRDLINECWKKLLINQFHDILPGTHIQPVTRDTMKDYEFIYNNLNNLINNALSYLKIQASDNKSKFINLVNTLSWNRKGMIFIEGEFEANVGIKNFQSQLGERKFKKGIWLNVDNIPAVGVKSIELENNYISTKQDKWFTFENNILRTDLYEVTLSEDGSITSFVDKAEGREIVSRNSAINEIKIYHDYPGMYDAWDILDNYKDKEENYRVIKKLAIKEAGSLFIVFEVEFAINQSLWKQNIRFYRHDIRVDFEHYVDWKETNRIAKAEFDFNILTRYAKCDIGAGAIIRETHKNTSWQKSRFEVCHHKWTDLSENGYGVSIINDCKYGISFEGSKAGLSLLRSPIRPDVDSDKETHIFSYALIPHKKSPEDAGIIQKAYEFNYDVYAMKASEKKENSFILSENDNIFIQTIKIAEDKNEDNLYIVRLIELKGERGKGTIRLPKDIKNVWEVNLIEDEIEDHSFTFEGNSLSFNYNPFEILTFKLKF